MAAYVIGHRGATEAGYEPQTVQAYTFAANYALVLEGDMRFTSDGVIVISHDNLYDGKTKDVDVDETRWSYFRDTFVTDQGNKVCTLGAMLRVASSRSRHVSLEFKTVPDNDEIVKVKSELAKYNMLGHARIWSFEPSTIAKVRKVGGINTGLNVADNPNINTIRSCGGSVALNVAYTTAAEVRTLRNAGIEVQLYTTNTDAEDRTAIAYNPNGIITDRPMRTSQLVRATSV